VHNFISTRRNLEGRKLELIDFHQVPLPVYFQEFQSADGGTYTVVLEFFLTVTPPNPPPTHDSLY
jgi:hypothetical protein